MIVGTLVRVIPLDGYRKFRVETGDVGQSIGTIQPHPGSTIGLPTWSAFYVVDRDGGCQVGDVWTEPEFAAVAILNEHLHRHPA